MGNAIRYLKYEISVLGIDLDEEEAKEHLCERIDHFIRDRITYAGRVLQGHATAKIKDGDVVLTYSRYVHPRSLFWSAEGKEMMLIHLSRFSADAPARTLAQIVRCRGRAARRPPSRHKIPRYCCRLSSTARG